MGDPSAAETTLARCPALADFTDETFLATGNPRFSGDMVLLSRIRAAQRRDDEALRLASRALAFRRSLLGAKLKTCDSLYDVAGLLMRSEKKAAAAELLRELMDMAEALPEGERQLARATWRLARLSEEAGRAKEAARLRERAREIFKRLGKSEASSKDDEDALFECLCP